MAMKVRASVGKMKYNKLIKSNVQAYDQDRAAESLSPVHIYNKNQLFIRGAVMQAPFFDLTLPASVTYGSLGFLVGRAMAHGFDKKGGKYDWNGLKRKWWDKKTKKEYKTERKCLVDVYDKEMVSTKNVDGQLTFKENLADASGIRAAFEAYRSYLSGGAMSHVRGYSKYNGDQTFFIGFATMMCSSFNQT